MTNHWQRAGIESTGKGQCEPDMGAWVQESLVSGPVFPDSVLGAGDTNSEPSGLPSAISSLR